MIYVRYQQITGKIRAIESTKWQLIAFGAQSFRRPNNEATVLCKIEWEISTTISPRLRHLQFPSWAILQRIKNVPMNGFSVFQSSVKKFIFIQNWAKKLLFLSTTSVRRQCSVVTWEDPGSPAVSLFRALN